MTTVDSHLHVNYQGLSASGIIEYLDKARIDFCWLLSWEEINPGAWPYKHLPIEDIYEAYVKYPSRIVPFYAPDPHNFEAAHQLANWHKNNVRGCGELKATLNWNSESVKSILQMTRILKLPIVFHMEESEWRDIPYSNAIYDRIIFAGVKTERNIYQIPRKLIQLLVNNFSPFRNRIKSYFFPGYMLDFASLEMTLQDYPDVNLIAHGPMFWTHMFGDSSQQIRTSPKGLISADGVIWRLLGKYPNLYADISAYSGINALTSNPENAKRFLLTFEDKILYGTDNFMVQQKEFLNSLGLPKSTYKKIYGENAYRILNSVL